MKKISVVMAVHNGEYHLSEAIESILKQSLKDFEFIIVDDASTDGSFNIIKQYNDRRILVIRNRKKLGLTSSLNIGLRNARSEFIARMDADDISLPNRFDFQLKIFQKDKNIALVGTWAELINEKNQVIGQRKFPILYSQIKKLIMRFNPFIHPSVMMRSKVLKKVGGYDESLDGAEDYDLFLRIVKDYKAINLPEILLKYRIQRKSVSWQKMKLVEKAALKTRIKALKEYGYPEWQVIYLIKPMFSFLIPASIKRLIFSRAF